MPGAFNNFSSLYVGSLTKDEGKILYKTKLKNLTPIACGHLITFVCILFNYKLTTADDTDISLNPRIIVQEKITVQKRK